MAAKQISLMRAIIKDVKLNSKMVLTTFNCTSGFDQKTAKVIGVMDSIYDEQGIRRAGTTDWGERGGLTGWRIKQKIFGATVTFTPAQAVMFADKVLTIPSVRTDLEKVLEQDSDGGLKLSFSVTAAGYPREMLDFLEAVKRGECAVVIELPNKTTAKDAQERAINFGLFKTPKTPKPSNDADDSDEEDGADKKKDKSKDNGGSVASAREMGTSTRRGRKKGQ